MVQAGHMLKKAININKLRTRISTLLLAFTKATPECKVRVARITVCGLVHTVACHQCTSRQA